MSGGIPAGAGQPRIAPLPPEEWDDFLRALLASSAGGDREPMRVFTTLGRHRELFGPWIGFGAALLSGRLPARIRELVILRTSWHCRCDYEWVHHVPLALQAGVDSHELEAVCTEVDQGAWSPAERAALAAADQLHHLGVVDDPTWAALADQLEQPQLIELVMLVGQYQMVAGCLRTFGVRPEEAAMGAAEDLGAAPWPRGAPPATA